MATVVLLGAASGIGEALGRVLAAEGHDLVLAGRDTDGLASQARDLETRYDVRAWPSTFEALDWDAHPGLLGDWSSLAGGPIEGVVLCYGVMADEAAAASDADVARHMIDVNFSSAVSILDRIAEAFEARGEGWICAVTSVAGDRGRASNFHYGATKAALRTHLSGLRVRLARAGVHVVEARPGVVDTRLTFGLPDLVLPARPTLVARDIARAIRRRRAVVYTPRFWAIIMLVIRLLPTPIFKRLSL